jgi:hypothetical protein
MADKKITELSLATAVTPDDLLVMVDDPAGSPVTKKVTVSTLRQPITLAYGSGSGNMPTDAAACDILTATAIGNTLIENPTNPVDGKTIRWKLSQDATGGRVWTLGDKFVIPSSATSPLPWSTAANATDLLAATYDAGRDKWDIIAFVPGY